MSQPTADPKPQHILVLGAGVIGLTTALEAQSRGHTVTILAKHMPGDAKSIHYCSAWAGAHHVSTYGVSAQQKAMESDTFTRMWEMSEEGHEAAHCFLRLPQIDYYMEEKDVEEMNLDKLPRFRMLNSDEVKHDAVQGVSFETVTIDTSQYLPYLMLKFTAAGGQVVRQDIQHLSQILPSIIPGPPISAIITCVGLSARYLGGIEDKNVYPIRGQVVLVRAPHIKFGRTIASEGGTWTYIIPRSSGDVILGGYKTSNDWTSTALPEHTTSILERALILCPELVPPESRADLANPTVDELRKLVIEEGCGLRPARKGGIRLEADEIEIGERKINVIHHYGHGGSGYQSSFGSATRCLDLLQETI